jgi:HD-GYP domain-containing protein (c-di-GMP phosphodiesterase class II)/sensor domain CHASE-containing protein
MADKQRDTAEQSLARRIEDRMNAFSTALPIPTPSVRSFVIFLAIGVILGALFLAYLPTYRAKLLKDARAEVESQVTPYGQALSATIHEKTGIVYGLTAFAKSHQDTPPDNNTFVSFAANLFPRDKSLVTVGISPGGVITYIYPTSPKSIGLDLLHDKRPDVRRDVGLTIASRQALIAGPVLHTSGKTVMVIRDPIFNADGSFWGITNVAFEKEALISSSGIDKLAKDYTFGVKERSGDLLDMSQSVFTQDPVIVKVTVPGTTWLIGAVPKRGWAAAVGSTYWPVLFGGLVFIFVLATLITGAIDRQNILTRAVAWRTSELQDANADLRRLNRLYSMLTAINEVIVRSQGQAEVFEHSCRIAVERGEFIMCWVGLVDETGQQVLPVTSAGRVEGYLDEINISTQDIESGRGPVGTAIRENKPIIVKNIAVDKRMSPWRAAALARGYRSNATFPIRHGDEVIGSLNVYSATKDSFAADDVKLLREIAADISYAVSALDEQEKHAAEIERRQAELEARNAIIRSSLDGTVNALATLAEHKDPYTVGHERQVAAIAVAIGQEYGLEGEALEGLHIAATLHDVGKMYVPTEILSKPGALSDLEFEMIKVHPEYSYDVLSRISFPWPIAEIVQEHHERLDGSGYPKGLKGNEVRVEAKILAVADVIEAMSSHRPYRPALSLEAALDEIKKNRGKLYDGQVVDAAIKVFENGFKLET